MFALPLSRRQHLWVQTAVLLLFFGLATFSIRQKAPTFDEQSYITRGLGYLRGENQHMRVGHPLGMNALSASLLVNDTAVQLPTDHPSWQLTSFHRPAELFMWEIGNDVEHVIFLGRLPTIWLTLLLASLVSRWARELGGRRETAVLALIFIALDPNILASGRLATTDLALAFGATVAGYTLWLFFKRPSWRTLTFAALGFAILQNTKFTAGLFVPIFGVVVVAGLLLGKKRGIRNSQQSTVNSQQSTETAFPAPNPQSPSHNSQLNINYFQLIILFPLLAFLFLWAMYGFQIGTLPDSLPTFSQLGGMTLPLAHHLEQLLDIGGRLQVSTPAFLLGNYSDSGWWYYFPIAFALKTPTPTLLFILGAFLTVTIYRPLAPSPPRLAPFFDHLALLLPPLAYFAFALTTDINLGYRHLLPMLPFLVVWSSVVWGLGTGGWGLGAGDQGLGISSQSRTTFGRLRHSQLTGAWVLALWLVIVSVLTFPHYLSFFNLFAGGADNGYKALVDSNIDWGQDLPLLKEWMDENGVEWVWLSYFGEARPEYYGIEYVGLDSFPPRLMHPERRPYNPHNPAPGIYAISATTLQGVHFDNNQQFAYFWDKEPLAKLGNSIFLYEVEPQGEPLTLVLDEIQLDELMPADLEQLGTNLLNLRWLYDGGSRLYPTTTNPIWIATRQPTHWLAEGDWIVHQERGDYALLELVTTPQFGSGQRQIWLDGEAEIEMDVVVDTAVPLQLQSRLQPTASPGNVRQFIHLTAEDGTIVAQWDGLETAWQAWQADDLLVQEQMIALPAALPSGTYQLWTGLYNPETGQRWLNESGEDRWLLETVIFDEETEELSIVNCQLSIVNCPTFTFITPSPPHPLAPSPPPSIPTS